MAVTRIGSRRVEESGVVLLAGGDSSAIITVRDLEFEVRILLSQDPPTGKYETPDKKRGIFTFVGAIGREGKTWVYNHVAKFGEEPIGVIIRIQVVGSPVGSDPIFSVTYTFVDKSASALIGRAA